MLIVMSVCEKAAGSVQRLLAAFLATAGTGCCTGALDDAENLILTHNQQFFAIELDLRAAVFAKQHAVARADIERLSDAICAVLAFACRHDFTLLRLLLSSFRDDDPAAHLLTLCDS